MRKLDYTLNTPEERVAFVEQYLKDYPDTTPTYQEYLADYIINIALKQEKQESKKKQREIITDNKLITINKRETSFEGLAETFENGEDGIYGLITENKHTIFRPKLNPISQKDLEDIPELARIRDAIQWWEGKAKTLKGKDKYTANQAVIDLRKDQYLIRDMVRKPIQFKKLTRSKKIIHLPSEEWVEHSEGHIRDAHVCYTGCSFMNPEVISLILCNYSKLKAQGEGNFEDDTWYMMEDFDELAARALKDHPVWELIVTLKIDGCTNDEIRAQLNKEFCVDYIPETISKIWRKKVPVLISQVAENEFLDWWFLEKEKGVYKKCNRCGEIKLAIGKNFSINGSSKDGLYSLCKECRNSAARKRHNAQGAF